jgi:hypothetical protein
MDLGFPLRIKCSRASERLLLLLQDHSKELQPFLWQPVRQSWLRGFLERVLERARDVCDRGSRNDAF